MLCCVIRVGGENGENFKMKRERERDSDPLKCSQNLCVMKYHFELNRESVCSLKKKNVDATSITYHCQLHSGRLNWARNDESH